MKIPQILAQAGIPAGIPNGSARASTGAAGAIAEGLGGIENTALRALDARQKLEREQERIAAEGDAAERLARFEVDLAELDTGLRRTITDPKAYLEARKDAVTQLRDATLSGASPATTSVLTKKLTPFLAGKDVDAIHHSDRMFVDADSASLERTLADTAKLAGLAPLGDDLEWQRQRKNGLDAIALRAPVIGQKNAAILAQKFDADAWLTRARRAVDDDPEGFKRDVEGGTKWQGVESGALQTLSERADSKIQTRYAQARQMRNDDRLEEERLKKATSDQAGREATLRWMDGRLTPDYIQEQVSSGAWDGATGQHYAALATQNARYGTPLDPALERAVVMDAYNPGSDPRAQLERITSAVAAQRLAYTPEIEGAMKHLSGRIQVLGDRAERRQQSELDRAQARSLADAQRDENRKFSRAAQQETYWHGVLRQALQVEGPLTQKLDPTATAVQSRAMVEYGEQVARGVPAEQAYRETVGRALPQLSSSATATRTAIQQTLGLYQTTTQANEALRRGTLKQAEWERVIRAQRDLQILNDGVLKYEQAQAEVSRLAAPGKK